MQKYKLFDTWSEYDNRDNDPRNQSDSLEIVHLFIFKMWLFYYIAMNF